MKEAPGGHLIYETTDPKAPDSIKDANGDVVLALCSVCGRGEIELDAPCPGVVQDADTFERYNALFINKHPLPRGPADMDTELLCKDEGCACSSDKPQVAPEMPDLNADESFRRMVAGYLSTLPNLSDWHPMEVEKKLIEVAEGKRCLEFPEVLYPKPKNTEPPMPREEIALDTNGQIWGWAAALLREYAPHDPDAMQVACALDAMRDDHFVFAKAFAHEPIFSLRGNDKLAAKAVRWWRKQAKKVGVKKLKLRSAKIVQRRMETFPGRRNPTYWRNHPCNRRAPGVSHSAGFPQEMK